MIVFVCLFVFCYFSILTFTTLWANSADDKLMILFFLFYPENGIWHFMQIVSTGDNLYEMSNLVFCEKEENYFNLLPADFYLGCKALMNNNEQGINIFAYPH